MRNSFSIILFTLLTLLMASCSEKSEVNEGKKIADVDLSNPTREVSQALEANNTSVNKVQSNTSAKKYRFSDGAYEVVLNATVNAEGNLEFSLSASNKSNDCNAFISGTAILLDGDMESREDNERNTYFVNQYDYSSEDCTLYISIEPDSEEKAWVEQGECMIHSEPCSFEPKGSMLTLVSNTK